MTDMEVKFIKIPMTEGVDSLNVSVACGIILYELRAHFLG